MTQEQAQFIEALYREKFEVLYHYAYTVLQDRPDAENCVNDTFLDAIKKAELLLTHENPGGWLMNALKLHLRHERSTRAKRPVLVPLESVQEQAEQRSTSLTEAEAVLSDEERYFYELYYKVGYSHQELAVKFGISVSASQKRLERIRKKLQSALQEE